MVVLVATYGLYRHFMRVDGRDVEAMPHQTAGPVPGGITAPWSEAGPSEDEAKGAKTLPSADMAAGAGMPSGINAEEWASIQAATADHPNPAAERERLLAFLRFQHRVEAWQLASSEGNVAKQEQLGQGLLNDLPVHLANAEISMPEAMMLCAAISHAAEASEQVAQQKVEQCQVRLTQSQPAPDLQQQRQRDVCQAAWRDRQAQLTAEFMKQVPAVRAATQTQFEQSLQGARAEVFASSGCAGVY